MREASGPTFSPLSSGAHLLEPVIQRARSEPGRAVLAYSADSAPCEALGRRADGADQFLCEAAYLAMPGDPPRYGAGNANSTWQSPAAAPIPQTATQPAPTPAPS